VCDNNWRPRADGGSVSTNRTGDHDSQIDLSKYRRRSTNQGRWLAGVRKRLGTQLTAAVILLLIVGVGLGGATLSTSLLADNTDDSLAPTDDQEWTEYETIAVFRNDDIQPWYKTNTRRAVDRVFIEEDVPVTLGVIPAVNGADSPLPTTVEPVATFDPCLRSIQDSSKLLSTATPTTSERGFTTGVSSVVSIPRPNSSG